jgi:hypothetical protein
VHLTALNHTPAPASRTILNLFSHPTRPAPAPAAQGAEARLIVSTTVYTIHYL